MADNKPNAMLQLKRVRVLSDPEFMSLPAADKGALLTELGYPTDFAAQFADAAPEMQQSLIKNMTAPSKSVPFGDPILAENPDVPSLTSAFAYGFTPSRAAGMGKGLLKTVVGANEMLKQGMLKLGADEENVLPGVDPKLQEFLTPSNSQEAQGMFAENALEFLAPGLGQRKALTYLPKVRGMMTGGRIVYNALTSGLLEKAHGGDFTTGAVVGGGADALGMGLTAGGKKLFQSGLNRLMYPNNADIGFFKNPARGIFKEGIVARNLESLGEQSQAAKQATYTKLENLLGRNARLQLPTSDSIYALDKHIADATNAGNIGRAEALNDMRDILATDYAHVPPQFDPATSQWTNAKQLKFPRGTMTGGYIADSPLNLELRNQALADQAMTFGTNRPYDNATRQIQKQIWGANRQMITDAVPGSSDLLSHYADLRGAANAANARASMEAGGRNMLSPMMQKIMGGTIGGMVGGGVGFATGDHYKGAGIGAAIGTLAGMGAPALVHNSPFYTGGAKYALPLLNPFLRGTAVTGLAASTNKF